MSAILNNVYNHYLTTYAPKGTTALDAHKKSELRSVYNSIVKLNKEAPWYLPDTSAETQAYAIDLKENSRSLKNIIGSMGGLDQNTLLNKKIAYSSNTNIATATFIGEAQADGVTPSLELEVTSLAQPQETLGLYLPNEKVTLPPDTYSFDVGISGINYEFQFSIKENETNKDIQDRLVRLINNAGIGLNAELLENNEAFSIHISSEATGLPENKDFIFEISDTHTSKQSGAVSYFGLNYISKLPKDASFLINGETRSASSNHFTIGKLFEVELNGISIDGGTTTIGLKTDTESLTENVEQLIGGYNSFVKAVSQYSDRYPRSQNLTREMGSIAFLYKNELDSLGISLQEDNLISLDTNLLQQSMVDKNTLSSFSTLKDFANSLVRKTSQVALNPMHYTDKTIVVYKNPGHNFASPYTQSAYSGMMFNSYC